MVGSWAICVCPIRRSMIGFLSTHDLPKCARHKPCWSIISHISGVGWMRRRRRRSRRSVTGEYVYSYAPTYQDWHWIRHEAWDVIWIISLNDGGTTRVGTNRSGPPGLNWFTEFNCAPYLVEPYQKLVLEGASWQNHNHIPMLDWAVSIFNFCPSQSHLLLLSTSDHPTRFTV